MAVRYLRVLALCLVFLAATSAPGLAQEPGEPAVAVFAGGCFWCMQPPYDELEGVLETEAGFTGGRVEDPSYEQVTAGGTGHVEAVRVVYDPEVVSYERLLHVFWRNVDPLDAEGQFCDRGDMYRSAIFAQDAAQREAAETSKASLEASGRFDEPVVTEIRDAAPFYPAEEYHQSYYEKRPLRYRFYVYTCGRYQRLEAVWGEEARAGSTD